ncbi:hypothetical protein [Nitrosomonas sp.]|uniref:hypothetical protein n=1 Tax=Nitrosomonas sp. TaxID=42353 RepID=UPI0037C4F016
MLSAYSPAQLLALWEQGVRRHPIDRALLLGTWARPDMPPSRLPDLPLGTLNRALLRFRESCFGSHINACADCEYCGTRLELVLDTGQLLADTHDNDTLTEFEIAGMRFRIPCSRDLAAIVMEQDISTAALKLLQQCCLSDSAETGMDLASLFTKVEGAMETFDPAADISLSLACEECGHHSSMNVDIGALLWNEIDIHARTLLADVHRLARAYGWTEPEILALSPQRRAAYLDMVDA